MAVPVQPPPAPLTDEEAAHIPSSSLPIGPQISHLLAEFTALSVKLFSLLSSASPSLATSSTSTQPIYAALAVIDDKLSRLLVMYDAHQRKQRRIETLITSLRTLDETWHTSASTLHTCLGDLSPIVSSGASDRAAIAAAKEAQLTPAGLLSYARLLAPFTSAPPSSILPSQDERDKLRGVGATDPTGRSLPMGAIPPFPTEAAMRRGRLQFGREGMLGAMGETNEVGARRDSAGDVHAPPKPDAAARLEQEAKAHGVDGAGGGAAAHAMDVEDFEFDLDLNPDL
ncbi:hypothetical protein JCM8547_007188 [Rhodosporidiobolus lusitaniae]